MGVPLESESFSPTKICRVKIVDLNSALFSDELKDQANRTIPGVICPECGATLAWDGDALLMECGNCGATLRLY